MRAKDLVTYLDDLIKKSDNPDELEVFNAMRVSKKDDVEYVKMIVSIDSNGIAEEKITIH